MSRAKGLELLSTSEKGQHMHLVRPGRAVAAQRVLGRSLGTAAALPLAPSTHQVHQRRLVALAIEPMSDGGAQRASRGCISCSSWSPSRLLPPHRRPAGTWLVVDGEVVPFCTLFAEVHPGLCQVLAAPSVAPHS